MFLAHSHIHEKKKVSLLNDHLASWLDLTGHVRNPFWTPYLSKFQTLHGGCDTTPWVLPVQILVSVTLTILQRSRQCQSVLADNCFSYLTPVWEVLKCAFAYDEVWLSWGDLVQVEIQLLTAYLIGLKLCMIVNYVNNKKYI